MDSRKRCVVVYLVLSLLGILTVRTAAAEDAALEYLTNKQSGKINFIRKKVRSRLGMQAATAIRPPSEETINASSSSEDDPTVIAEGVLRRHGQAFGVANVQRELLPHRLKRDEFGMSHVRFQQVVNGVPVFGNQILVHLENDKEIDSVNGRFVPGVKLNVVPKVIQNRAVLIAKAQFALRASGDPKVLKAKLYVFNPGLLDKSKPSQFRLAWEVELGLEGKPVQYSYFIDANTAQILFVLDQVRKQSCDPEVDYCPSPCDPLTEECCDTLYEKPYIAPDRAIFDCSTAPFNSGKCSVNKTFSQYGTYLFGKSDSRPQLRGTHPIKTEYPYDTDNLFRLLGYMHKSYLWTYPICRRGGNDFGGIGDNASYTKPYYTDAYIYIEDDGSDCSNFGAFYAWNQVSFCGGAVVTDYVAHEYAHSLTYFLDWDGVGDPIPMDYWGQTGALQENYSDLVGEGVDYVLEGDNSWINGDRVPNGPTRSLADPPSIPHTPPYPDRFYSPNYYCGLGDTVAIHTNVGVPNKAAYLMAEGGTFNGCTIQGIGREKVELMFFRAVTQFYTPNTDFNDAYYALIQACNTLYSTEDCAEVTKALQAVEMDQPGRCSGIPATTPACAVDGCPEDPNKTAPGICGCGVPDTDTDEDGTADCLDGCVNDPAKTAPGTCGCGVPDVDTDADGVMDCVDGCPTDRTKTSPGVCGCGVADTDTDGDGTADCNDLCPADPGKTAPGVCGCGVADTDSDGDGTPNCNDQCPNDPAKVLPGVCGCGTVDTDTDGDGTPNCNDQCPSDPGKVLPGTCGCGTADVDTDGDGVMDCVDGCPGDRNKTAPGVCGCGTADTDSDGDGTPNCHDNCPSDPAKVQPGVCGCGTADTDTDGDGTPNCNDQCPADPGKILPGVCGCGVADTDSDGDGTPNCRDSCPTDRRKTSPGTCGCGTADTDTDGDGTPDCNDLCPVDPGKIVPGACGCGTADTDSDGDGTPNCNDGCPADPGKVQPGTCGCGVADTDSDGDGTANCNDLCPSDPGKVQPGVCGCGTADTDSDGDGTPNCNDGCPSDPAKVQPGVCGCGTADTDSDGDGTPNCNDQCPADPGKVQPGTCGCGVADTDSDGDGTPNCNDQCPNDPAKVIPGTCGCGTPEPGPDADHDGYPANNACNGINDCNDNDASINPGHTEVCSDGKDNNCNGQIDENCSTVCNDSDNGLNWYTAGTVTANGHTYKDSCIFGLFVVENYCLLKRFPAEAFMICIKGCTAGACRR